MRLNFGSYSNLAGTIRSQLGASGSIQWYIGQHSKVRSAFQNGDLASAVDAASVLNDLGINGRSASEVMNSPDLLRAFRDAILITHAPGGFYASVAGNVNGLINPLITKLTAPPPPPPALPEPQPVAVAAPTLVASNNTTNNTTTMTTSNTVTNTNSGRRGRWSQRRNQPQPLVQAPKPAAASYLTASGVERKIINDPNKIAAQGGKLPGSDMTVKQALTSKDQYIFTRSSDQPGSNRIPNYWSDLGPVPEGFNEEIYLQKNPDVAKAVKEGAMPSGLWHYLKYGKNESRTFNGWRAVRRPGYLSGVFANWKTRD